MGARETAPFFVLGRSVAADTPAHEVAGSRERDRERPPVLLVVFAFFAPSRFKCPMAGAEAGADPASSCGLRRDKSGSGHGQMWGTMGVRTALAFSGGRG